MDALIEKWILVVVVGFSGLYVKDMAQADGINMTDSNVSMSIDFTLSPQGSPHLLRVRGIEAIVKYLMAFCILYMSGYG